MGRYFYLLTAVSLIGLVVLRPQLLITTLNTVSGVVTGAFHAARG